MSYRDFIDAKRIVLADAGLPTVPTLNPMLYGFQRDIVAWALRKGRAALFCDCGMGKTPMQLEWARHVPGRVLILATLAVSQQTVREGKKFGVDVTYSRQSCDTARITITNYEMLEHFYPTDYAGVVLDESSILKSYDGAFRNLIISSFSKTPFRLACTATPAPNDYMELGNHCEFLGSLTRTEMLSTFFVHDGGDTSKWRVKKHAAQDFWRWVCSWAVMNIVTSSQEGAVTENIKRKEQDAAKMAEEMVNNMHELNQQEVRAACARMTRTSTSTAQTRATAG